MEAEMGHREMLCVAGDWLQCTDGHDAFRALRDIRLGEVIWSCDLADAGGQRPKQNQIESCPVCGRGVRLSRQAIAA
jgi:hypothetical protein